MSQHRDAPARPLYDHVEGIRIRKGWTKTQLARAAKTDRGTIEKWKQQPRAPLPQTVRGVANALGMDLELALKLAGILDPDEERSRVKELEAQLAAERERRTEIEQEFAAYKARQRAEDESRGKAG